MRGHIIDKFKIGFDYSDNFTKGYCFNTETGEYSEANVSDFNFSLDEFNQAKIKWEETQKIKDTVPEATE